MDAPHAQYPATLPFRGGPALPLRRGPAAQCDAARLSRRSRTARREGGGRGEPAVTAAGRGIAAGTRATGEHRHCPGADGDRGERAQPARPDDHFSIVTDWMTTSSRGRSRMSVLAEPIVSTTFLDSSSSTWPNTVCLPCRCGVGPRVMKNCEPLVPEGRPVMAFMRLPALAMAST